MNSTDSQKSDDTIVSAQLRGETIGYAVQSGFYNLAANFFEPYINYRTQKYFSEHGRSPTGVYGNYTQNLAGEFAGDVIGAATLIGSELICPKQLHYCLRSARSWVDPLYTSAAKIVFANDKDSPDYEQKMEHWKTFQERNLVRSTLMGAASIAGNIAMQKLAFGNPSPTNVIFKGKLLSTALTTTLGLGTRLAFPAKMHAMDKWVGKTLFTPMLSDVDTSRPSLV